MKSIGILILISTALYITTRLPSCGPTSPPGEDRVELPLPPPPSKSCGDLKIGETKKTACPTGTDQKVEACTEAGLVVAIACKDDSNNCGKTTFADVKPIISSRCVSCHNGYDTYSVASKLGPEMVRRINLADSSGQRMPKLPNPPLSTDEKSVFAKWQLDSFLEKCPTSSPKGPTPTVNFDQIESSIIDELNKLNEDDRQNSRFLVMSHKVDEGALSDLDIFTAGSNKTVNSIAARARRLSKLAVFGPNSSLLRIDLNAFELKKADWDKIILKDPLKIESFTNKGKVIKFLTQNSRPWMHFDNFIDVTQGNADLYYDLLGVPNSFTQLTKNLGVDYAGDFLNFKAMLIGTNKSPISLQKNRLISRHDSLDDYFWATYDTVALANVKERNLFQFPLLKETGGKAVFDFAAGEVIFTLPNQLQGYALFNSKGVRQNAAPLNVVTDVDSPITPEIKNAISCHRCHNAGLIPAVDEIRDHVLKNASEFNNNDVQIVKALYRTADINAAQFKKDDDKFALALTQIGVSTGVDPINYATDRFLLNWDVKQTASFLFLKPEEFIDLLNQSAVGRAQIGQLLSGGFITHDQFVQVLPVLIKDLRLFQEQLGG